MTTMSHLTSSLTVLAACLAAATPLAAQAQSIPYGDMGGGSGGDARGSSPGDSGRGDSGRGSSGRGGDGEEKRHGVRISPYIEAAQVATAELSPGNDVLTYSRLAVGVDASVSGRNTGASASLRYEHYFGWGKKATDGDYVSGIARGYATLTPGVRMEAGGMAGRSRIEGSGAATLGPLAEGSNVSNIYSAYAGPTVSTQAGPVKVDGGYRIGYTRVESPDSLVIAPGQPGIDVFDDSVTHNATLRAATRPGDGLPVGIGVGGGYYREDISNLDQRVEDKNLRGDVTVQLTNDFAVVGGIGYEDVRISSRDALRDANGDPVIGSDGHYLTDKSAPRRIAFDTSGLTWDAGVIWRPSRRTAFEAHVGKRYGSTTYYGSFAYAPSARSSINVSVYDSISGFGGQLNNALAAMPTDFTANRDVLSGNITGCVASTEGNNCLSGVLGSVRSSTFRGRGIQAAYNVNLGRVNAGVGLGYDRRKFLAAPGTVLASAAGVIDENIWMSGYVNSRIGQRGTIAANAYANWFESGNALGGDSRAVGASTAYGHQITERLSATAALGVDGLLRDNAALEDVWTASALVGVSYRF